MNVDVQDSEGLFSIYARDGAGIVINRARDSIGGKSRRSAVAKSTHYKQQHRVTNTPLCHLLVSDTLTLPLRTQSARAPAGGRVVWEHGSQSYAHLRGLESSR